MKNWLIVIVSLLIMASCDTLMNMGTKSLDEILQSATSEQLTQQDIINGLKEALNVGTQNAVQKLSLQDGFYKDPKVRIPFPEEVNYVAEKLRSMGMGKLVDDFEMQMNRGAENAVKKAVPIFTRAITEMSISDAKNILHGADNAATEYFKSKTSESLFRAFKPEVQKTLEKLNVTKYWTDVTTAYNKIPFTQKVNTDLAAYVTQKTMDGLFVKLAEEEKKIRHDPVARVTELLKKVFGSLDN